MSSSRNIRESIKKNIAFKQHYKCDDCKNMLPPTFQVDHITPFSLTADNSEKNLQILCANCHSIKTQKEYNRIILFKRYKKILDIDSNLCWFCVQPIENNVCDCNPQELVDIEPLLKLSEKKGINYQDFDNMCNTFKNNSKTMCKRVVKEVKEDRYIITKPVSDDILFLIISEEYVICNDKKYEGFYDSVKDLGESISESTRTKKCSRRYTEIVVSFDLDKNEYDLTPEKKEEFSDFIIEFLPEHIPDRILKDNFILISVE